MGQLTAAERCRPRGRPEKRQCSQPRRDGKPCGGFVVQGTEPPLCFTHSGRRKSGRRPHPLALRQARHKRAFLARLAETGIVSEAARAAGVARNTPFGWRNSDPDFATAWDEAAETAVDAVELEARRRGVDGFDEPVFYQGEVVGCVRRYSDRLLETLLRISGRLAGRIHHQHAGVLGGPILIADARESLDAKLERLRLADRHLSQMGGVHEGP